MCIRDRSYSTIELFNVPLGYLRGEHWIIGSNTDGDDSALKVLLDIGVSREPFACIFDVALLVPVNKVEASNQTIFNTPASQDADEYRTGGLHSQCCASDTRCGATSGGQQAHQAGGRGGAVRRHESCGGCIDVRKGHSIEQREQDRCV